MGIANQLKILKSVQQNISSFNKFLKNSKFKNLRFQTDSNDVQNYRSYVHLRHDSFIIHPETFYYSLL